MENTYNVVVIGGGAAGFFAALAAAESGATVAVIEKSPKVLSKVKVSGGGRCNVTHAEYDNTRLVKSYPRGERELRSPFSRFSVKDTVAWFEQRGVELKTEADGRMFPITDSSETIIHCLLSQAKTLGIAILLNTEISAISKEETGFMLTIKNKPAIGAGKVIVATGGAVNVDKLKLLQPFNLPIVAPVPSLFTFNLPTSNITKMMGVSVDNVTITLQGSKQSQTGPLLITHWGLSGPAVLKLSAWAARELQAMDYNFFVDINWVGKNEDAIRAALNEYKAAYGQRTVAGNALFGLPKRLWEYLCNKLEVTDALRWGEANKATINKLAALLTKGGFAVKGKTTFKEEFVTSGGIALKAIDFKTMQSKEHEGLYFAGEVLDIDGITGGFNFQAAWTTGYIAGSHAAMGK